MRPRAIDLRVHRELILRIHDTSRGHLDVVVVDAADRAGWDDGGRVGSERVRSPPEKVEVRGRFGAPSRRSGLSKALQITCKALGTPQASACPASDVLDVSTEAGGLLATGRAPGSGRASAGEVVDCGAGQGLPWFASVSSLAETLSIQAGNQPSLS